MVRRAELRAVLDVADRAEATEGDGWRMPALQKLLQLHYLANVEEETRLTGFINSIVIN